MSHESIAGLAPFPIANLNLSDRDLEVRFWGHWVLAQLDSMGINQDQLTPQVAEQIRVATLHQDCFSEGYVGVEKALKLIAAGWLSAPTAHGQRGTPADLIRQHFHRVSHHMAAVNEASRGDHAYRKRQSAAGKKRRNRRADCLTTVIREILKKKPHATTEYVLNKLRNLAGGEHIHDVTDSVIVFADLNKRNAVKEVPIRLLASRIAQAREFLRRT
jgi:hypothetical protein